MIRKNEMNVAKPAAHAEMMNIRRCVVKGPRTGTGLTAYSSACAGRGQDDVGILV